MPVFESVVDGLVEIAVVDLIGPHAWEGLCDLVEFASEVFALLVRSLGGSRQGGEFGVDLDQQLVKLAKVKGAGMILIILLKQSV